MQATTTHAKVQFHLATNELIA